MGALQQGIGQLLTTVANFIPKLLVFLILLLIGWIVGKAVSKAIHFLFGKIGFNKLMQKTGLGDRASGFDVGEILVKLVYYFILLIFLQLALGVFGPNPVSQFINQLVSYLPQVFVAVILVLIAAAVGRMIGDIVQSSLGGRPMASLLGKATFGVIVGLGVIAALNQMGIAATVTEPVLVTFLATLGGVIVVGAGGGLIKPMQSRWSDWLQNMESEFKASGGTGSNSPGGAGGSSAGPGQGGSSATRRRTRE